MKGLILAAGKGTRLRPITFSIPKPLVPIANKPILLYAIEAFISSGINDIGIVIDEEHKMDFQKVIKENGYAKNITFIIQSEAKGIAHAILCAEEFIDQEPFVVQLGDNLIFHNYSGFIQGDMRCRVLLAKVDDVTRYGIAELEQGKISNLVEKPERSSSDLAMVGLYLFNNEIFEFIHHLEPSRRGEYEITDAIRGYLKKYQQLDYEVCDDWWKDTGTTVDLLAGNSFILKNVLESKTNIGKDTQMRSVNLKNNSSIGKGCRIINSDIDNSIIMDNVLIENVEISNSIIGENCVIRNSKENKVKLVVFTGNNTIIEMS